MSYSPTIVHFIHQSKNRSDKKPALRYKDKAGWQDISWSDYYQKIEDCAAALLRYGIRSGDRVAIMSNTRHEWGITDFAILSIGAITVPIYHNNNPDDVEYIINNSASKILFCENKAIYRLWMSIKDKCPTVKQTVVYENFTYDPKDFFLFAEFQKAGQEFLKDDADAVVNMSSGITPDSVASILYTSGTTGRPKGVTLLHSAITSEVSEAFPLCGVTPTDDSLAFLPFAHVMGRIELWGHMFIGFTINYAESIESLKSNLVDIKPTVLVSVPRIYEKIYSALLTQMETQPLKSKIFHAALAVGKKVSHYKLTRTTIPLEVMIQFEIAKKLVLNKVKNAFGGKLRFAISGGAPIHSDIALFFHASGILILEGYGLTETTAAITVNTPFNYRFGSVGRPIGDVQLKIAEDGEILVKSKKVMRDYYNNPEATAEVFTDGWFHTGDIGEILPSGDLKITDRKKDLIKSAGGKYIAPQRLEGLLKMHPLISQVVIHGDQKKYIVALLSLEKTYLISMAKEKNWVYEDWTELIENKEVQTLVKKIISETNAQLSSFETIKKFKILPVEFTIEGGELTPSMKVKRKALEKRYVKELQELYD